uniref:Uncharacterized protein n=1 Tax=Oryza barthii TaxID=65489 RepID=A0A0D3FY87_9ORYZ
MSETHEKDKQFEKEGEEGEEEESFKEPLNMLHQNPFTVRWHLLKKTRTSKPAVARKCHQRR